MSQRPIYHLAGKRGLWNLWQEGVTEPVLQTRTKQEAIAKARALAKRHLARLLIHSERGGVSLELTFD
jgi:hypothetical protein